MKYSDTHLCRHLWMCLYSEPWLPLYQWTRGSAWWKEALFINQRLFLCTGFHPEQCTLNEFGVLLMNTSLEDIEVDERTVFLPVGPGWSVNAKCMLPNHFLCTRSNIEKKVVAASFRDELISSHFLTWQWKQRISKKHFTHSTIKMQSCMFSWSFES